MNKGKVNNLEKAVHGWDRLAFDLGRRNEIMKVSIIELVTTLSAMQHFLIKNTETGSS